MKILKLHPLYRACLDNLYSSNKGLASLSYKEQSDFLFAGHYGWPNAWSEALIPLNYEVFEITSNCLPLQRAWAKENSNLNYKQATLDEISLEQIRIIKPDVLWIIGVFSESFLIEARKIAPKNCLFLGWTGSAVLSQNIWKHIDITLTCAPEAVKKLKDLNVEVRLFHHAFAPSVNEKLVARNKLYDTIFIGQIVRANQFHMERERLLEFISKRIDFKIFTPSATITFMQNLKSFVYQASYLFCNIFKHFTPFKRLFLKSSRLKNIVELESMPSSPVNAKLKSSFEPAVFGLDMFQVIRDSKIVLNVHADSSPTYASNMALFETTGVGTCLLTDYKTGIDTFFEPDKEIVTYKSPEECVEKINWLLDNSEEREEIALAGQRRCLQNHTFEHRALELDAIIKEVLR